MNDIMFKVGQKVRVKQWLDMPEDLQAGYGMNVCKIGEVGTIVNILDVEISVNSYDVIFENNEYPMFFLEGELEPDIKVGEQLLLFEL